jgi:hypothetical protein
MAEHVKDERFRLCFVAVNTHERPVHPFGLPQRFRAPAIPATRVTDVPSPADGRALRSRHGRW